MDEIEYKLNTNNSVLVVNAIDKLISTIKSKYKPAERQKFVLENEELKLLREKCSSKEVMVSLTACQGLLALVELGVLEIAHTMSTVVTLLPTAHNYSAIVSTMTGLLILDLKSRLIPGQPYKCQFSLKSPQHPFITVLEKNKGAEDDVFAQMQALCTHTDYTVSSNSLELLRPVFLYLTCNPEREGGARPWQLLLSLPRTDAQSALLLACLSCQQLERALGAYSAVADAAIYQRDAEHVAALLPMLARVSNELLACGRDPRPCYRLIARCLSLGAGGVRAAAGVALHLLAANLPRAGALYLHDTLHLGLTIISQYEVPSISLSAFVAQSLQWLHQPSLLTSAALKVAAEVLDVYRGKVPDDTTLHIPNLMSNKIFQALLYTDSHLSVVVKLHLVWERLRNDEAKLTSWFNRIESMKDSVKVEFVSFFYGVIMGKNIFESVVLQVLRMVVGLVDHKKDIAVELLPILVYKIANDVSPAVKLECLRALPLMAKTKENVPTIVSILNKLKANKGVPTSVLIMLYTSLAETQVRCFPYLQEILAEPGQGRPDDLKWEVEVARILAVKRMCELRASSHGLELVSLISSTLNRCGDRAGAPAACLALRSVALLWRQGALAAHSAWRALEPKLARDARHSVQIHICALLSEIPPLANPSPEYAPLASSACRRLWLYVASGAPAVAEAACRALSKFSPEHYVLKDVPEIYRKTVKLPASYCKTPADAARKPEDVLDYVPSEVWPEVFKYTNQAALAGVVSLVRRLIEREVTCYRSGVYHIEGKEPTTYGHLPAHSVLRGVMDAYRKRVTSPSFECPEVVTLAMLDALCGQFPRPAPPLDVHFLAGVMVAGGAGRRGALTLAANQGKVSPSAKAIVENWILGVQSGHVEEEDIILFYELLPTLTRFLPPNTLRGPLERTLADAYSLISHTKSKQTYADILLEQTLANIPTPWSKNGKNIHIKDTTNPSKDTTNASKDTTNASKDTTNAAKDTRNPSKEADSDVKECLFDPEDSLFEKQLKLIRRCLECDGVHEANRTLLSQLVEHYFPLIGDDNVAWATYVQTCCSLSSKYLERMTSPTGWWEVSGELVRKAGAVRSAVAGTRGGRAPLAWLNEYIDAQATQLTEQDTSLRCLAAALLAAEPDADDARDWLLQLMARAQLAFNQSEDQSAKLYLFNVFVTVVATWSGHWALEADPAPASRPAPLLPAAISALLQHTDIGKCTLQILEWLCGTREAVGRGEGAWCQRALLALRHTEPFSRARIWTRLESHFGKDIIADA